MKPFMYTVILSIVWSTCIQLFLLEELRERKYDGFARKIQKAWRRYKSEQYFYELKKKGTYCIIFRCNHIPSSCINSYIAFGKWSSIYRHPLQATLIPVPTYLSHRDGVWYWLLTMTGTNFDTSITEDGLNSAVQFPNVNQVDCSIACVLSGVD